MADDFGSTSTTPTTSTTVEVMSSDQVTNLINSIVTAIGELKTALVDSNALIKVRLDAIDSRLNDIGIAILQLQNATVDAIGGVKGEITDINTTLTTANTHHEAISTKLNGIDELDTQVSIVATNTGNIATYLKTYLPPVAEIAPEIAAHAVVVGTLKSCFETDISVSNLNLEYNSKSGVKGIGYTLASAHELSLLKYKRALEEDAAASGGGSSDSDSGDSDSGSSSSGSGTSGSDTQTSEAASAVDDEFNTEAEEVLKEVVGYECDVTIGERIQFKSREDFDSSRIGLPFDFTRRFYEKTKDVVDNTEVTEYAMLVFDSALKTSVTNGSSAVNKVKSWVDVKEVQTFVLIENTLDKSAHVYMPTKSDFITLDSEKYKTVQTAMDAVVDKYLESIDKTYAGIAIIPVESIESGISLEEYRTAAKNITPISEYA